MNVHKLKEVEPYYSDVASGKKQFEVRRDQNFQIGDIVMICQYSENIRDYTGVDTQKKIVYILRDDPGLQPGYVILGLEDYSHKVDTSAVRMKVHRESFDFLSRDLFGDCPHCGKHIQKGKSEDVCSECGKPVSWSENKFF